MCVMDFLLVSVKYGLNVIYLYIDIYFLNDKLYFLKKFKLISSRQIFYLIWPEMYV